MQGLSHRVLAELSIAISIGSFISYAWGIFRGLVRPHLVCWLIWTLLTAVIFLAQLSRGGGDGAWATAVISILCLVALIISFFRGDKSWKPFDWLCLGLTLLSIPLWMMNGSPLYSVILLTFIEFLGFAVMTPKTWKDPHSESPSYFVLGILKHLLGAAALNSWSLETALYPVATAGMLVAFSALILIRRIQIPAPIKNAFAYRG